MSLPIRSPLGSAIDWAATISFRRRLLDLGLGVAEAMDTAQRGFGLDWTGALELVRRSLDAASSQERQRIFSGVGTDHLAQSDARSLDDVVRACSEQSEAVQLTARDRKPQFPDGIVNAVSFVSTTNTASSSAGFVSLALALMLWRSPGSSEKLCPAS